MHAIVCPFEPLALINDRILKFKRGGSREEHRTSMVQADQYYSSCNLIHRCPVDLLPLTATPTGYQPQLDQTLHQPVHPVLQIGVAGCRVRTNQTRSMPSKKKIVYSNTSTFS